MRLQICKIGLIVVFGLYNMIPDTKFNQSKRNTENNNKDQCNDGWLSNMIKALVLLDFTGIEEQVKLINEWISRQYRLRFTKI